MGGDRVGLRPAEPELGKQLAPATTDGVCQDIPRTLPPMLRATTTGTSCSSAQVRTAVVVRWTPLVTTTREGSSRAVDGRDRRRSPSGPRTSTPPPGCGTHVDVGPQPARLQCGEQVVERADAGRPLVQLRPCELGDHGRCRRPCRRRRRGRPRRCRQCSGVRRTRVVGPDLAEWAIPASGSSWPPTVPSSAYPQRCAETRTRWRATMAHASVARRDQRCRAGRPLDELVARDGPDDPGARAERLRAPAGWRQSVRTSTCSSCATDAGGGARRARVPRSTRSRSRWPTEAR